MASSMNTTCTKCGKEVSVNYLGRHYQRYHTLTAKTFPCNLCDKIFYEKLRLNQHTRARHNDNPDLIPNENLCIECGKTFISGERLREHKANIHVVDQVTLTCKVCEKDFQNAKVFKRHSRKYHLELPCSKCDRKFGSSSALREHSKKKHPE